MRVKCSRNSQHPIKAVLVKLLVIIGIIPSSLLANAKVTELPTWRAIQISVLS
jgi:hypothetical protein